MPWGDSIFLRVMWEMGNTFNRMAQPVLVSVPASSTSEHPLTTGREGEIAGHIFILFGLSGVELSPPTVPGLHSEALSRSRVP